MIGRVTWIDYTHFDDLGNAARVSCRMEDGTKRNFLFTEVEPWGFVHEDADIPDKDWIVDIEHGYESLFDDPLKKVQTITPNKVNSRNDNDVLASYVDEHFESDLPMYRKLAAVDEISGYIDIPEPEEERNGMGIVSFDDVDVDVDCDDTIEPRVLIGDIEVRIGDETFEETRKKNSQPINVICSYDSYDNDLSVFFFNKFDNISQPERIREIVREQWTGEEGYEELPIELNIASSEEEMLNAFMNYIIERSFDLTSGWNWIDFDWEYIVGRMNELGDVNPSRMSPFGRSGYKNNSQMIVRGLPSFDMMEAFVGKITRGNWRSKALDYVANEELGVGKIDTVDINEDWKKNPERLIGYNIVDVLLTVALDDKNDIHGFFYEMADVCSIPIYDAFFEKRLVDGYVLSRRGDDEILPSADESELAENAGGYVADPINGIKESVGVVDLKSLYPSVIITWNLSTETVAETPEDFDNYVKIPKVPEPKNVHGGIQGDQIEWDWLYASLDEEGLIPRTTKELFEKRNYEKKQMYAAEDGSAEEWKWDRKQGATKVVMNCFTEDTEVITTEGVKNIRDISVGEEVYSINPDSLELEKKEVVDSFGGKNRHGELVSVKTDSSDFKVTPNHRFLTQRTEYSSLVGEDQEYSFKEVQDYEGYIQEEYPIHTVISSGDKEEYVYPFVGQEGRLQLYPEEHGRTFVNEYDGYDFTYEPQAVERVNANTRYILENRELGKASVEELFHSTDHCLVQYDKKFGSIPVAYEKDSWAELVGWYVSEGHVYEDDCTNNIRVHISQKDEEGRKQVKSLLERMDIPFSETGNGYTISSPNLAEVFSQRYGDGSYEKKLHEDVFGWHLDYKERLFDSLVEGDGDINGQSTRYTTASEQLKEDIVRLGVEVGYKPKVRFDGCYRVFFMKRKGSFNAENNISKEKHDGDVYCITVEDNHTVLAGRNGTFQWVGQSVYGNLSSKYYRLSNEYLGDAVTSTARYTLWKGRQTLDRIDYEHIYSDTDSHFLQLTDNTVENRVEELKNVASELDADASRIAQDIGIDGEHPFLDGSLHGDEHTCLVWEPEKIYSKYLQLDKKKRYAGNREWKEGTYYDEPNISISGYENQRADSMPVSAELQEEVLTMVLTDTSFNEVSSYINSLVEQIDEESEDVRKFALPGSINKALEDYPNRQIPRACMWANEHLNREFSEGDDPFVYLVNDTPPAFPQTDVVALEWNEPIPEGFELDESAIIERGIKKPIDSIIREMGWNFSEIRSGKQSAEMEEDLTGSGGNPFA